MMNNKSGGGGSGGGERSSRKRRRVSDAQDEEEEFLEAEMVRKYSSNGGRGGYAAHYGSRISDISMIMYRMFLLHHRTNDDRSGDTVNLRSRIVVKPRELGEPLQSGDIDRCWGRLDFGFEPDKSYVLSASRRSSSGSNSRRSDAQFTYYCDNLSGLVSTPHCELLRPNHSTDFVWIKDLNSEHGTFVNGKKITPMTKYKLVDGDMVGLGVPHNCPDIRVNVKNRRFYILKVKNIKRVDQTLMSSVVSSELVDNGGPYSNPMEFALSNVLILDKVLSYLKLKDLKNCRLLSSFWKSRADIFMIPRVHLKFEFTYHPRYMTVSEVKWSDSFQAKITLVKKYKIPSFEIDVTNNSPIGAPRQFFSDVQWLLDNMGDSIKDLILSMSVVNDRKGKGFQKVFSQLTNVENLDLSLDINTSVYPKIGSTGLCLPAVKRLALWCHDVEGDDEMRDPMKNHIIAEMAKLFPNLKGISVKTGLLNNFLRHLQSNPETWKELKEISAEFEMYGDIEDPVLSFTTIGSLPQPLSKIQLDDIPPMTDLGAAAFEKMLKKHSSTLEFLCLKFSESGAEDNQRVITLPSFPRLTCLEIIIYVDNEDLHLKLQFPSGPISYEKDFPKIQTLSLLPLDSLSISDGDSEPVPSNLEAILNTFLPEDSQTVCSTMRWVEFTVDKELLKKENPRHLWYKEFLLRFRKTFPHVNHPDIIRGLQSVEADAAEEVVLQNSNKRN